MEEAENSMEHEEVLDRRRREAEPVVVGPARTLASPQLAYYPYNSLPASTYNTHPVYPTIYHPYQPYQPLTHPMSVAQTPLQVGHTGTLAHFSHLAHCTGTLGTLHWHTCHT